MFSRRAERWNAVLVAFLVVRSICGCGELVWWGIRGLLHSLYFGRWVLVSCISRGYGWQNTALERSSSSLARSCSLSTRGLRRSGYTGSAKHILEQMQISETVENGIFVPFLVAI